MEQAILIPIEKIVDNPYQHREQEDPAAVEELAISIARIGLKQYPEVRAVNNHYELSFGHTRTAAYRLLATKGVPGAEIKADKQYLQIPVYIRELTDKQMFEVAISENLKRRQPKPTEEARAIEKYMTEFKATSKEAGELFSKNDATVRGMVRLLDLIPEAQIALDEGKISQGTARTILSMQKIASGKDVITTLQHIEKQKGNTLPEEVICDAIEQLDNVVDLWSDDRRDGNPRAGYYGWELNMKKFPNQFLPDLTKDEAALEAEQREHLIDPPACVACPFYTKVQGNHYCGLKICFDRKTKAWKTAILQKTSKQTGIAIYSETDGSYRSLGYQNRSLFDKRHKDLRLITGNEYQGNFEGVDDDHVVVVATGEALNKLHENRRSSKQGGKLTEKEKAERRAMKVYRARRIEMLWECTAVAKSMFDSVPLEVLNKLNGWHSIMIDDRIPDAYSKGHSNADNKGDYQRRALVWRLIMNQSSHYHRKTMAAIVTDMQKFTGAKAPKALLKLAEQWDAEINALAKVVAVETGKGQKG